MIVELYSKGIALVDTVELPGGAVPRVGETVTLGREVGHLPRDTELLVHEVTHVLKDGSIHPLVRCHAASGPDARRVTLEEHGWL